MLRNVAGQLERRRPLPPRARLLILQLCYKKSRNAWTRDYSASNSAALQSLSIEYHAATSNGNLRLTSTHLPNDRTSQQNAFIPLQNRSKPTQESVSTKKTSKKLLEHMAASHVLQKVLGRAEDVEYWKTRIAGFRTFRLSVVLLQELMRQEAFESNESSELLPLLPTEDEMDRILKHPRLAIHSREALDYYVYVLRGRDDEERCQRFLEKRFFVPQFVFNFLIRPTADFIDTGTLLAMIESCHMYFDAAERAKMREKMQAGLRVRNHRRVQKDMSGQRFVIDHANFDLIMRLLAAQCLRLEPRYIILLADRASRHIERMSSRTNDARKMHLWQCKAFNGCLQAVRPQPRLQTVQQSMPNVYFWEAQRILLTMSGTLPKPLLISRAGFRAIRDVLSGLPKNYTEVHSSLRHAPGWPPYLQPGHGMDELSDPEDNWSRTVSAGMLMQEAGYSKEQLDMAVDILQGMAVDGAPTIQQRKAVGKGRGIGVWEASIRATRNAQEAWGRFRDPPELGLKPGLHEYAAMFEKLMMREVEPESGFLPGDKALNFSTQHEANLAEFERARLRPPSVSELYGDMKLAGVRPQGACLRTLVANADSLETAHQYLRDSSENGETLQNLMADEPDPSLLRNVPLSMFAAYIKSCLQVEGLRGNRPLMRAIRLSEVRLQGVRSRWMAFVWGIILKDLSQHHRALRISLTDQLGLISRVADTIETRAGLQLSSFTQFNKCVRKAIRREARELIASETTDNEKVQRGIWQALCKQRLSAVHGTDHGGNQLDTAASDLSPRDLSKTATTTTVLQNVGGRMKAMFWGLATRERDVQRHLDPYPIAPLERLSLRGDVVRSEHAYEYMLSLGYLGEFDEMGRFLDWLIRQWGHADIVSALGELDEPPPYADFFETLCVFRLVAEPMLDKSVGISLLQNMNDSGLDWVWPDDEAVKTYAELQNDGSIGTLWQAVDLA
ncbi:hypothetical protein E4U54_003614 [Claviceps lovelessii]|nr:hypothetical protein E4U54_003614 [Claviceps lovelessii]